METHVKALLVGQPVWFVPWSHPDEEGDKHLAAIVAKVNEDGTLNLCVFSEDGRPMNYAAVPFHREGDDMPENHYCCEAHPEKKPGRRKKGKKR